MARRRVRVMAGFLCWPRSSRDQSFTFMVGSRGDAQARGREGILTPTRRSMPSDRLGRLSVVRVRRIFQGYPGTRVGQVLRLGSRGEIGIEAPHGGQVRAAQERVEVDRQGGHYALTAVATVVRRVWTCSAPMPRGLRRRRHAAAAP